TSASVKPTSAKPASTRSTATKSPAHTPAPTKPGGGGTKAGRRQFLAKQMERLLDERRTYTRQAEELKAQADSLALEHEPGDVQFDEEGGEGGTSNVDRELDLVLSGQARATITEIDRALAKIDNGTYGHCETCGAAIPDARLEALPHAALCVACKSGGLSSRR
ncbi:MAG: TraR/DksA family transcriptional regulator, partial [Acidimicrobiales bacterium]